jgi:hypothetical protein
MNISGISGGEVFMHVVERLLCKKQAQMRLLP